MRYAEAVIRVGQVQLARGHTDEGMGTLQRMRRELVRRVEAQKPGLRLKAALAQSHYLLSHAHARRNRLGAAMSEARKALEARRAIFASDESPVTRRLLAKSLVNYGSVLLAKGRSTEAMPLYQEARAEAGALLLKLGRAAAAAPEVRAAQTILEALVARDAEHTLWEDRLEAVRALSAKVEDALRTR